MAAETPIIGRPVHDSVEALLAGAVRRGPFVTAETRSGAVFEQVLVDGEPCVVKYTHPDDDYALRATGDTSAAPMRVWEAGLMDVATDVLDHATLGMAPWGRDGIGWATLMRDVSAELLPTGDDPVTEEQHLGILDALAAFSAAHWNQPDTLGLLSPERRWQFFGQDNLRAEADAGFPEPLGRIALDGWERFAARVPTPVRDAVESLRHDAGPLAAAVADTPSTLLHGDWKFSNLGRGADGRTVVVDWAYPGYGPVAHELAWYVSLNRARLPDDHTKESTIADLGAALDAVGVDRTGWWDRQVAVCLAGNLVQFGWEKALGPDDELGWWVDRFEEGMRWL